EAAAEAVAVNRGDDGHLERLDAIRERRNAGRTVGRAERAEPADVGAGREGALAGAAEDDDARVADVVELGPEVLEDVGRDRVHRRVVEPDRLDHCAARVGSPTNRSRSAVLRNLPTAVFGI